MVTTTPAPTSRGNGCSARDGTDRVQTLEVGQTSRAIAAVDQCLHQRRVLRRGDAVPDAFRAQEVEGVPDRLRTGGLPRVRHGVQPRGLGPGKVRRELRARDTDLGTAEPEAHQSVRPAAQRDVEGHVGGLEPASPGMSKHQRSVMSCSRSTVRRASSIASQNASAAMP